MTCEPPSPEKHYNRFAVIDIGTNSVLMLICDIHPGKQTVEVVLDTTEIPRLGHGLHSTGQLQKEAIDRTCATIAQSLIQAQGLGVERVIAVGTSVLREAANATDFITRVKDELNLDVEVISGTEEARFSYLAVCIDANLPLRGADHFMLIDIGGGSTEFVFRREEGLTYWSLNLGAVYLTDRFFRSDPPTDEAFRALRRFLERSLSSQIQIPPKLPALVGIGGTLVNLAAVKLGLVVHDPSRIHGEALSLQEVTDQLRHFRALPLNERLKIPGLEAKRADVIIAGAAILQSILRHVGAEQIYVSTHGVRYGVMSDRFVSGFNGSSIVA